MVACLHVKLNWESSLRWQREREKKRNFDWVTVPESEKEFNVECITMYQKERHKAMLTKIHHRDTTLKSLHRQKNKINLHISHLPDYSVLFFLKSETKKKNTIKFVKTDTTDTCHSKNPKDSLSYFQSFLHFFLETVHLIPGDYFKRFHIEILLRKLWLKTFD